VSALIRIAADAGYDFGLLRGVVDVNQDQFDLVTRKVVEMAGGSLDGLPVAAWGLTFKARTDDLRESPALQVIARLRDRGARIRAYDPAIHRPLDGIDVCADPYDAANGADAVVVATDWPEFHALDLETLRERMRGDVVLDGRDVLADARAEDAGLRVLGAGWHESAARRARARRAS
jgi:UDPglucose 6-dehydrogenase